MKSLLVIQPLALGDIVHGLQVIQSLAWARPDCRISWLVSEEFSELVKASPFVRDTITYSPKAGFGAWWALRRNLETRYYDAVWDLQGVLRSSLLASAVKTPDKVGRADASKTAGFFYTRRTTAPTGPNPHHTMDVLQPFLRAAGVPQRLYFPMELRPGPDFAWSEFFSGDPRNTFVIFTDQRNQPKPWPYFSELTAFILDKIPESRVAWCAAEPTQPNCVAPSARFLNRTGCPLAEMIALVRQPATFIGLDGGPMHLSAALGNPVLGLFGMNSPRESGPYPLDAAKHLAVEAPEGRLAKLQPAAVLTALEKLRQRAF